MHKEMRDVGVASRDGNVVITQEADYGEVDEICLHPDQVPLVIEWINEARLEAERQVQEKA